MKPVVLTIEELVGVFNKANIKYAITRLDVNNLSVHNDLDVLVKKNQFQKVIKLLKEVGYRTYSHDKALGGRIKGYQVNLVKKGRVTIDLHQDFTWRRTKYLDNDLVWDNLVHKNIAGVKVYVPTELVDAFLVRLVKLVT